MPTTMCLLRPRKEKKEREKNRREWMVCKKSGIIYKLVCRVCFGGKTVCMFGSNMLKSVKVEMSLDTV